MVKVVASAYVFWLTHLKSVNSEEHFAASNHGIGFAIFVSAP